MNFIIIIIYCKDPIDFCMRGWRRGAESNVNFTLFSATTKPTSTKFNANMSLHYCINKES